MGSPEDRAGEHRRRGWDEPRPLGAAQLDELVSALRRTCASFTRFDAPLGALTSYRVGGRAAVFAEPRSIDDLVALSAVARELSPPTFVLGKGSNLLVTDQGWNGLVIHLDTSDDSEFKQMRFETDRSNDDDMVAVLGGSVFLPKAAKEAAANGFGGLEWAVGIPGTVGGAMRMNAGISERSVDGGVSVIEIKDQLIEAELFNLGSGELRRCAPDQLDLSHRHSNIGDDEVVLRVTIRGRRRPTGEIEADLAMRRSVRKASQEVLNTAGSVWRNQTVGDSSGRIIDQLRLRGHRFGTAQISDIHCNFIRTDAGGRAEDVIAVMEHTWSRVFEARALQLVQETEFLGMPRVDERMSASVADDARGGDGPSGERAP